MERKGVLNAFTLKLIMAALMVLDHVWYFFPPQPVWFHYLGRLVAPVFCFLMVESYAHTRHKGRYIIRIGFVGVLMLAGNLVLERIFNARLTNNILLALAMSAAILYAIDTVLEGQVALGLLSAILLLVGSHFLEGGTLLPIMAVIFYVLRTRPFWMAAVFVASTPGNVMLYYALQTRGNFSLSNALPQMLMALAVIPILLYNGKRGPNSAAAKWFFYIFYPLHIWVLYILSCKLWYGL